MSLLPGQIIPPSEPIGKVNDNGDVVISKNWWLLLYNICQQALSNGASVPVNNLIDIADADIVDTDSVALTAPINSATLLATDNLLQDPATDSARLLLALTSDSPPLTSADLPGHFGGFANPTAKVGTSAVNGSASTAMRSDASPPIDQGITPTWTNTHIFSASTTYFGGNGTGFIVAPNYSFQQAGTVNVGLRDTTDTVEMLLRCDSTGCIFGAMTSSSLVLRTANITRITIASGGAVTVAGNLSCNGVTPPAQITGWGTPTGATVVANFPGATATLAQCSGVIAKLITDLKAFGLYGA